MRTVLSPNQIRREVEVGRWKCVKEGIESTNEGMLDGTWEVGHVLRSRGKMVKGLEEDGVGEREIGVLGAMWDAVEMGIGGLEGGVKGVRAMDHWVGVYESV